MRGVRDLRNKRRETRDYSQRHKTGDRTWEMVDKRQEMRERRRGEGAKRGRVAGPTGHKPHKCREFDSVLSGFGISRGTF